VIAKIQKKSKKSLEVSKKCVSLQPVSEKTSKRQFIDNIERHKEVKKKKEIKSDNYNSSFFELRLRDYNFNN